MAIRQHEPEIVFDPGLDHTLALASQSSPHQTPQHRITSRLLLG